LMVLLMACSGSERVTVQPDGMMENLRTSLGQAASVDCVEEAVFECVSPDGVCESEYSEWVDCLFDSDCVDADGVVDALCADTCLDEADAFEACVWDDCDALQACEPVEEEPVDPGPTDADCADAELACYADGQCGPVLENWNTCASDSGCLLDDGTADFECALATCGADYGAVNECVYQQCDPYLECLVEEYGRTGDPCSDAAAECFYLECPDDYGAWMGCLFENQCIDAHGFYDDVCGQQSCAVEMGSVSECISASCPDYIDACH